MIYLAENDRICLIPYTHADDTDLYACWQDVGTQKGYNTNVCVPFENFAAQDIDRFRFWVTVVDKASNKRIGSLRLGLDPVCPDLAIWIYPSYRNQGYGSTAFALALKYIFERFDYSELSAGCYENNVASLRILTRLGFVHVPALDAIEDDCFSGGKIVQREYRIKKNDFAYFRA